MKTRQRQGMQTRSIKFRYSATPLEIKRDFQLMGVQKEHREPKLPVKQLKPKQCLNAKEKKAVRQIALFQQEHQQAQIAKQQAQRNQILLQRAQLQAAFQWGYQPIPPAQQAYLYYYQLECMMRQQLQMQSTQVYAG